MLSHRFLLGGFYPPPTGKSYPSHRFLIIKKFESTQLDKSLAIVQKNSLKKRVTRNLFDVVAKLFNLK